MFSRRAFLGGLTGAGTLLAVPAWSRPTTFRMVYFSDFAPFSQSNGREGVDGLFVTAAQSMLHDRLGLEVVHHGFPWARAQAMVREGEADGFITVPTPERLAYVQTTAKPVFDFPMSIIAAADGPRLAELRQVRTLSDLKSFRVGHYIGSGWADANLRPLGLDIQWAADLTGAMRLVANGRVDAVVDNAISLRYRVDQPEFQGKLTELPNILATQPYHLCIGKTSPFAELMPRIDGLMGKRGGGMTPLAKAT